MTDGPFAETKEQLGGGLQLLDWWRRSGSAAMIFEVCGRGPVADTSTYPVSDGVSDEELLMLADILPTGYEVGVPNGRVPCRNSPPA
jgi:hypothetical protein